MNKPKLLKSKKAPGQSQAKALLARVENAESAAELLSDREERLRALKLMFGAWKGRTDIPNDGLVFQEQLRSECRLTRHGCHSQPARLWRESRAYPIPDRR